MAAIKEHFKIVPPIQWYEGMMLCSQHMQQNDLRVHQLLTQRIGLISPHAYGVVYIRYDPVVIGDGFLRILDLEAVMPDGEIIDYAAREPYNDPLEIDLKEAKSAIFTVWVGLPYWNEAISPLDIENPRYKSVPGVLVPDNQDPESVINIPRLMPRLQIYIDDKPRGNLVSLPVLKFSYVNGLVKEEEFIPPCFEINPESSFFNELISISKKIRENIFFLTKKYRREMGTQNADYTQAVLEPFKVTMPFIDQIVNGNAPHPNEIYKLLSNIIGRLSTIRPYEVVPSIPKYNHDDLLLTFRPMINAIKDMVEGIDVDYRLLPFEEYENKFTIPTSLLNNKDILIGIRFPKRMPADKKIHWIENAIITGEDHLHEAIQKRIMGASRKILNPDVYPTGLYVMDDVLIETQIDDHFITENDTLVIFNPMDHKDNKPYGIYVCIKQRLQE